MTFLPHDAMAETVNSEGERVGGYIRAEDGVGARVVKAIDPFSGAWYLYVPIPSTFEEGAEVVVFPVRTMPK